MTTTPTQIPTGAPTATGSATTGRIGDSPLRADGTLKVTGEFAYASDLADELGLDRLAVRQLNGMREGDENITGQLIDSAAPVAELLEIMRHMPLPPERGNEVDLRSMPGGISNTTHGEGVVRGVGYAVTYKNTPYGVRGVGEPPTISSGPAVAAAIRQATGRALRRVPIRPEHITGT